jgi:hypothetical protein
MRKRWKGKKITLTPKDLRLAFAAIDGDCCWDTLSGDSEIDIQGGSVASVPLGDLIGTRQPEPRRRKYTRGGIRRRVRNRRK